MFKVITVSMVLMFSLNVSSKALDQVSPSGWMHVKHSSEAPSCAWLKANGVQGIESDDTYEITTEELCDLN